MHFDVNENFCESNSNLGVYPTWAGMFAVAQRSRGIPALSLIESMTSTEAINVNLKRGHRDNSRAHAC